MSDNKTVLLPEEIQKLRDQQQQFNKFLSELGALNLSKKDLKSNLESIENEEKNTLNDIDVLRKQADSFQKELVEKYGAIDVDLTTGEYTILS